MGVYYGAKKPDPTPNVVMKTEQVSMSEDEGEVISSDEEGESKSPKAAKSEPLKTSSVKEEKDDDKKIK